MILEEDDIGLKNIFNIEKFTFSKINNQFSFGFINLYKLFNEKNYVVIQLNLNKKLSISKNIKDLSLIINLNEKDLSLIINLNEIKNNFII